jgi:hypothetical protein
VVVERPKQAPASIKKKDLTANSLQLMAGIAIEKDPEINSGQKKSPTTFVIGEFNFYREIELLFFNDNPFT